MEDPETQRKLQRLPTGRVAYELGCETEVPCTLNGPSGSRFCKLPQNLILIQGN
jgi:hypothetical protein